MKNAIQSYFLFVFIKRFKNIRSIFGNTVQLYCLIKKTLYFLVFAFWRKVLLRVCDFVVSCIVSNNLNDLLSCHFYSAVMFSFKFRSFTYMWMVECAEHSSIQTFLVKFKIIKLREVHLETFRFHAMMQWMRWSSNETCTQAHVTSYNM